MVALLVFVVVVVCGGRRFENIEALDVARFDFQQSPRASRHV